MTHEPRTGATPIAGALFVRIEVVDESVGPLQPPAPELVHLSRPPSYFSDSRRNDERTQASSATRPYIDDMTSRMLPLRFGSQTVLITGASSGLGAEFARQLASRGSTLVLVARREPKLEGLAADLRARYGVTVTTIAADLGKAGAASTLRSHLEERDVRVTSLINNAGFGTSGAFHEEDPERVRDEIALNVAALVDLTQSFIAQLRAGDGFLVNVASVAGYQPTPGFAVYGATKAFVRSFTEAIWAESMGTGLRVVALSPGPTSTEFFEVAGEDIGSGLPRMTARSVVAITLRELKRSKPGPSVVPGPLNTVLTIASKFAPRKPLLRGMSRALGAASHSSQRAPTAT